MKYFSYLCLFFLCASLASKDFTMKRLEQRSDLYLIALDTLPNYAKHYSVLANKKVKMDTNHFVRLVFDENKIPFLKLTEAMDCGALYIKKTLSESENVSSYAFEFLTDNCDTLSEYEFYCRKNEFSMLSYAYLDERNEVYTHTAKHFLSNGIITEMETYTTSNKNATNVVNRYKIFFKLEKNRLYVARRLMVKDSRYGDVAMFIVPKKYVLRKMDLNLIILEFDNLGTEPWMMSSVLALEYPEMLQKLK